MDLWVSWSQDVSTVFTSKLSPINPFLRICGRITNVIKPFPHDFSLVAHCASSPTSCLLISWMSERVESASENKHYSWYTWTTWSPQRVNKPSRTSVMHFLQFVDVLWVEMRSNSMRRQRWKDGFLMCAFCYETAHVHKPWTDAVLITASSPISLICITYYWAGKK